MKACCSGCNAGAGARFRACAYQAARPSSVVMDLPATSATGATREGSPPPPPSTEQEPHCASPQPNFGPRKASSFASTYSNGVSGLEATGRARPFTVMLSSSAIGFLPSEARGLGGLHLVAAA